MTLTSRQAETLDVLRELISRNGYPPSARELADELGAVVSVVHRSLTQLRAAGIVTWEPNRARTLRVIEDVDGIGRTAS